jgi:cell division septal protein FtsQ
LRQSSLKGCNAALPKFTKIPVAGILTAALFAGLVYLFAWSSIFSVSSIAVTGAPTSETQKVIAQISDVVAGQKLARVEPRAISHRIEQLAWIKKVDISRNWVNGKVSIAVTPRTPTAYFNGSTIDASGTVFSLPGFTGGALPQVSAPTPRLGLSAISLFQDLPGDFRSHVNSLSAHNDSNFAMEISLEGRAIKVMWGKNEKNSLKIQVIKALLTLDENRNVLRIDVSAPHAPIVK